MLASRCKCNITRLVNNGRHFSTVSKIQLPKPVKLSSLTINGDDSLVPIIVIHGLFGSKHNWKGLARQINERTGRNVHAIDLRNHGDSPHTSPEEATYLAMAADIRLFIDDKNVDKIQVVGHSMGGRAAFQFSFLFPERVERVAGVDISPLSAVSKNTASTFIKYVDAMEKALLIPELASDSVPLHEARKQVDSFIASAVKDKFIRDFLLMNMVRSESTSQLMWKFNLTAIHDMLSKDYINELDHSDHMQFDGSACFIYGEHSNYLRESDFDRIKEMFTKATFHRIADAGHYLHVEKQKEFLDVLIPFLK